LLQPVSVPKPTKTTSLFKNPKKKGIANKKKKQQERKKKCKIKIAKAINPIPPKKIVILNGFLSCANFISKYTVNAVYSQSDLFLHLFCKWHQKSILTTSVRKPLYDIFRQIFIRHL